MARKDGKDTEARVKMPPEMEKALIMGVFEADIPEYRRFHTAAIF